MATLSCNPNGIKFTQSFVSSVVMTVPALVDALFALPCILFVTFLGLAQPARASLD